MKAPYLWLTEYVVTHLTPTALGERLQQTSSVVESVENWSEKLVGLIVGQIISADKHSNSDHLHVVQVDTGHGIRQIVCGAPNVQVDTLVIVALPGVKVGATIIQETVIRGVVSSGMLCSYEEIGLPIKEDGIAILSGNYLPGSSAVAALGLEDTVLDLEITPNRPDLLGIYGLAREVASFEHRPLLQPVVAELPESVLYPVSTALCSRYLGVRLSGLKVTDSPATWQRRLILAGIRPINNLVDVSNYVMLELGQPLHAFDAALLGANTGVRLARNGETLHCLDGQIRTLTHDDIIVTDSRNKAAALAGIMGGSATAIRAETTDIFLESAVFSAAQIRRSSRHHALRSEASSRMEKGLDPVMAQLALKRAVHLLQEQCGAQIIGQLQDSGIPKSFAKPIRVSYEQIHSLLGVSISPAECKRILLSLGFHVEKVTKSSLTATAPSWRQDITIKEDLIEELVRIWGYDRVPATLPSGPFLAPRQNLIFDRKRQLRHALAAYGLHETVSLSLTSGSSLKKCAIATSSAIHVQLPLSLEGEYLIPEHLVPFLQNISGANRSVENLHLFEIGSVFAEPLIEETRLSFIIRSAGPVEPLYQEAKGLLLYVAMLLELPPLVSTVSEQGPTFLHQTVDLRLKKNVIGWIGEVKSEVTGAWKIRTGKSLVYCSLNLTPWLKIPSTVHRYRTPSAFSHSTRDLTFSVLEEVPVGPLIDQITLHQKLQSKLPKLQGLYRSQEIGEGRKSVTVRLFYGSELRTLTDAEIVADLNQITSSIRQDFQAIIS